MSNIINLFLAFIRIGLVSFGGGYAALAVIQSVIVNQNHWIDIETFKDMITISQMTPGPIGINSATFVGIHLAGLPGGVIATLGFVTPSIIICFILANIYLKYGNLNIVKVVLQGMRPVIIGVIFAAGFSLLIGALFLNNVFNLNDFEPWMFLIFIISMLLMIKFKKLSPILVMLIAGVMNLVIHYFIQ